MGQVLRGVHGKTTRTPSTAVHAYAYAGRVQAHGECMHTRACEQRRCPRTCAGSPLSCPSTWRNVSLPWRRTRVAESTSSGWSRCVHWCVHGVCIGVCMAWCVHGMVCAWSVDKRVPGSPLATSQLLSPRVVPSAHPLRTPYSRVSLHAPLCVPSLTDYHQECHLVNRVTDYLLVSRCELALPLPETKSQNEDCLAPF